MTLTQLFTQIANAIRKKKGTTAPIVAEDFPTEIGSIQTGSDISEYLGDTLGNGTSNYAYMSKFIKKIPSNVTVSGTSLVYCFRGCSELTEVPSFDTSSVTLMIGMFRDCSNLETVPIYNTSGLTGTNSFNNMFQNCSSLSNTSLNNIMKMCINATSYTGTKTLATLGITSAQATICQGLSNYADFVTAGWSTGY